MTSFHPLQRRDFLTGGLALAGAGMLAGCGLLPPQAPTSERVRLIGVLGGAPGGRWDAFWDGLRKLGWIEGQNLAVESRWAGGDSQRYGALATELVERKVELIVVGAPPASLAAKQATLGGDSGSTHSVAWWRGAGQLTFGPASMADLQRIVLELDEAGGPLTVDELVERIKEAPITLTKRSNLKRMIERDRGRQVVQLPDMRAGTW